MDIANVTNIINVKSGQPVRRSAAKADRNAFAAQPKSAYGVSGSSGAEPIVSPLLRLRLDYDNWKGTQEPQTLPNSRGRTEENMNYLAQRYSGPLTMFQKIEALDTMFDMGILTTEQRSAFYGDLAFRNFTAGEASVRGGPLEEDAFSSAMAQQERELYRLSPLAKSETLEDMFSWLDDSF